MSLGPLSTLLPLCEAVHGVAEWASVAANGSPSGGAGSRRGAKWLQRGPLTAAALLSASTFVAVLGAAVLLQLETQSFGQYLHNLV